MLQNVFGSDGKMHVENQIGNQRFDLTTGEAKTVIPTGGNMSMTVGKDGVQTEVQLGRMRQIIGKPGFDLLL